MDDEILELFVLAEFENSEESEDSDSDVEGTYLVPLLDVIYSIRFCGHITL